MAFVARWISDRADTLKWGIIVAHLALSLAYSVVVPVWEAHDEWPHFKYAEYVARHWALPPASERLTTEYQYDQNTQPPLYYVLVAIPLTFIDTSDGISPVVNPYADTGTGAQGVNFAVHSPDVEAFPYRGTILAVHVARVVSSLIGLGALWATYQLGALLWPRDRAVALVALAIAGFSPQFLFINSVVTNDVLITTLGCWFSVYAVRVVKRYAPWSDVARLGVIVGLGLLTKYTALAWLPVAVAAVAWGGYLRGRESEDGSRGTLRVVVAFLVALVLLTGWWFFRNLAEYGVLLPRDPAAPRGLVRLLREPAAFLSSLAWDEIPGMLAYGFRTFWLSFGWGNIGAPEWVYQVTAGFCLLAGLGCARLWVRGRVGGTALREIITLAAFIVAVIALPLYRELYHKETFLRGRYLLPSLAAVSVLMALGLAYLAEALARFPIEALAVVWLASLSVASPVWLIIPAYRPPELLQDVQLTEDEQAVHASFGDRIELVAYKIWPDKVRIGQAVSVTLLWRALAPMDQNYTLGLHVVGDGFKDFGELNTYPGRGNFATTLWKPGDVFRETYWIPVELPPDGSVPTAGKISVAWFVDDDDKTHLPAKDAMGNAIGEAVYLGRFKIAGEEDLAPVAASEAMGRFADAIALLDAGIEAARSPLLSGDAVTVTLSWGALAHPNRDWTAFVHLTDGVESWAVADGPPLNGEYPTGLWDPGERLSETRVFRIPSTVPSGRYNVVVGLYDPETGERLPVSDAHGSPVQGDAISVGSLTVVHVHPRSYLPAIIYVDHLDGEEGHQP